MQRVELVARWLEGSENKVFQSRAGMPAAVMRFLLTPESKLIVVRLNAPKRSDPPPGFPCQRLSGATALVRLVASEIPPT
jgi:hypothetical protein